MLRFLHLGLETAYFSNLIRASCVMTPYPRIRWVRTTWVS